MVSVVVGERRGGGLLVVDVPADADVVALAVAGGVASGDIVISRAWELGKIKDLDDGTAGGRTGGGAVNVRVRTVRHN